MLLLTVRLPAVTILPDDAVIVTLSTFDVFLTLKSLSTVSVPSFCVLPETVRFPPRVVAPLLTLSVPVDCISNPSPFLSCKSPVPSTHVDPLALPPVICKLPVSAKPNFAHAAPVQ